MSAHQWITICIIIVQLKVIYFWYSECKSSHTVYYIDCTLLSTIIRHLKKELVFHCWMLNDIFHYGDIGTEMSCSEMIFFISLSKISVFLSLSEILVFLSQSEISVFLSLSEIWVFLSLSEIWVFLPFSEIWVFLSLNEYQFFFHSVKYWFFFHSVKYQFFFHSEKYAFFFHSVYHRHLCNKHKTYKQLPD